MRRKKVGSTSDCQRGDLAVTNQSPITEECDRESETKSVAGATSSASLHGCVRVVPGHLNQRHNSTDHIVRIWSCIDCWLGIQWPRRCVLMAASQTLWSYGSCLFFRCLPSASTCSPTCSGR